MAKKKSTTRRIVDRATRGKPSLTATQRKQVSTAIEARKKRAKDNNKPMTAAAIRRARSTMEATILRRRKS